MKPTPGRIVLYRSDARNGLVYDLPAIITVTKDSHPGSYPDGRKNPLPAPMSQDHVHLTVFSPGGFKAIPMKNVDVDGALIQVEAETWPDADDIWSGSGTYVELQVPFNTEDPPTPRSWRWPERV